MNFVKLEGHEQAWNQFCFDHAWFWHTSWWQEYIQNARFGVEYKNHSFFIDQGGIVGIVPLIQEDDQFTYQGGATPEYVCRPEHEKAVLAEIKRLALKNGVKRIHIRSNVKGYLDASTYTCVLGLGNIQPTKGHRAAIKKAEKHLTWEQTANITEFMKDYFKVAGKVTRPEMTFYLLLDFILMGYGTLLKAKYKDKTAGWTYILHWKDCAYYFMSCVFSEFKEYNVSHFLQAKAFDVLRQKGIKRYELGEQAYNTLHSQPSEKERNISLFKRGFGGQIIRSPASEYFFDVDYMCQVYTKRLEKYIEVEYNVPI